MTPVSVNYFLGINKTEVTTKGLTLVTSIYLYIYSTGLCSTMETSATTSVRSPLNLYKQRFTVAQPCGYTRNSIRSGLHTFPFSTVLCMSVCFMRCSFIKKMPQCADVLGLWVSGEETGNLKENTVG
jgi:hypothetical protein